MTGWPTTDSVYVTLKWNICFHVCLFFPFNLFLHPHFPWKLAFLFLFNLPYPLTSPHGLKLNTETHMKNLLEIILGWIERMTVSLATELYTISHKQTSLLAVKNVCNHITSNIWLRNPPDFLYSICGVQLIENLPKFYATSKMQRGKWSQQQLPTLRQKPCLILAGLRNGQEIFIEDIRDFLMNLIHCISRHFHVILVNVSHKMRCQS